MANPDPEEVRRAAREILAEPEFVTPDNGIWSDIARALIDPVGTISKALEWLLSRTGDGSGSPWLAWGTVLVAVLIITFVVVRVAQSMVRDSGSAVYLAPDYGSLSWQELAHQAEEAESRGEWRDALRLRYSSLVTNLAEQGLLERRAGRTTGEYARQMRVNAPDSSPAFNEATSIFDFVWYGDGVADSETVDRFRRLSEATLKLVAS